MLFSRIFRNFKVPLLPSIEVRPSKYDVFNHSTLRKMGYSLDKERKWVLKKTKATSKEEDDDEDDDEDEDAIQWRKSVDEQLALIQKQQAEIITIQAKLATQQSRIETQLQSIDTYLREQVARLRLVRP